MDQNKEKIRCILQYYFDKLIATTHRRLVKKNCGVYGEGAVSKSAAREWFAHFRYGNFDAKDEPPSDWPNTEKSDEILEKIEQDRHISSHDIAYELTIYHQTVLNHLKNAGFKKELNIWVPHEMSVKKRWTDLASAIRC